MRILPILALVCICFSSCVDEIVGPPLAFTDVGLTFKGTFDGEPFVQNRPYIYNGARVRFSKWNFFVSSLSTTVSEVESFSLDEIEYVDLGLFEGEEAALEGFKLNVGRAPVGVYQGFTFGIGVNSELNKTFPDDYGVNHPLGNESRLYLIHI